MTQALYVVNSSVSVTALATLVQVTTHAVVVSSQQLFPDEIERLRRACGGPLECYCQADFFDDTQAQLIDNEAVARVQNLGLKRRCHEMFRSFMIKLRTESLLRRLTERFPDAHIYHCDGLGIDGEVMRQAGSCEIAATTTRDSRVFARLRRFLKLRGSMMLQSNQIDTPQGDFVVVGSPRRICGRLHTDVRSPSWLLRLYLALGLWSAIADRRRLCVPMHEYRTSVANGYLILQDGHLPSNYSAGVAQDYMDQDTLVAANPFARRWADSIGLRCMRLPFFRDRSFAEPTRCRRPRKVLFALNHGGDWTAQIHRSDTDKMVLHALRLAEECPDLEVRVRLHPTMSHPGHEGPSSIARIESVVADCALPNLECSSGSLDADLNWSEFVVSEYSEVLIDAWRQGKLGASLNPSQRRSFMMDYEELGFMSIRSATELSRLLDDSAVDRIRAQQCDAVGKINSLLAADF